jgi:hypothetical protein
MKKMIAAAVVLWTGLILTGCKEDEAPPPPLYLTASEYDIKVYYSGEIKNIDIKSNISWTAEVDVPWLDISAESGTGNSRVTFTCEPTNSKTEREGHAIFKGNTGEFGFTLKFTQFGDPN